MYGIHTSFYSIGIAIRPVNRIITSRISLRFRSQNGLKLTAIMNIIALRLRITIPNRLNDPRIESMIPLTYSEQTALIPGTK